METRVNRGSDKLMAAWKARALTEDSVREIAAQIEKSPATVERADVAGGSAPTGVSLSLSYSGDDTPWCGNDILFWLKWHRNHGGSARPPRILINGIPFPDWVRLDLDFGHVGNPPQDLPGNPGQEAGGFGG
jgi:hypothetical protein